MASQRELFRAERRRQSEYLDRLLPPAGVGGGARGRRLVPFESAEGAAHRPGLCPRAFLDRATAYSEWHAREVGRLRAVQDDTNRLLVRFANTTSPSSHPPLKVLMVGFDEAMRQGCGLADRVAGLLSVYLLALLTHRLLLVDEGLPDLLLMAQLSNVHMQSGLTLNAASYSPPMTLVSHSIPRSALARCSHGQCSAWTGHEGLTQTEVGRSTTESSSAGLVGVDRPWPAEPPPRAGQLYSTDETNGDGRVSRKQRGWEKTIAAAMLSLCGCAAEERAQRSDAHDTEAMRSERTGCTAREDRMHSERGMDREPLRWMRHCATASRIGLMRNAFLHPVQKYPL